MTTAIAPNNAALIYSPYNWSISAPSAISINAGAYFSTLFTGTTCLLNFDVLHMASPVSQIWWRIDAPEGPWTKANVATTVTLTIPASTISNADIPYHLLEVTIKSTTETANRWNSVGSATGTAVIFTGLTLDTAAVVAATLKAPLNILMYGDSITEGVRTVGESATDDTDRNDSAFCWAYRQGALLGAEVGVVGFGGQGILATGSGNVPAFPSAYNLLYGGVSRSFALRPNLIVIEEGTNDGGSNTIAAMTGALNGLQVACPGTPIAVLRPFNGTAQASNLQAAIAACGNPSGCLYVNTNGFFDTTYGTDGLNLHPSGPNDLGRIAPQVAAAVRALLAPAVTLVFQ